MQEALFDEFSEYWTKDPEHNFIFLWTAQGLLNKELASVPGIVITLDEVCSLLDICPVTGTPSNLGWVNNPTKVEHIDFGLFSGNSRTRDFVNGYERSVWLRFNAKPLCSKEGQA